MVRLGGRPWIRPRSGLTAVERVAAPNTLPTVQRRSTSPPVDGRVGSPSFANVEATLRAAYGRPRHHNKRDPLSELVFIILSTQTREPEYRRTFAALWKQYRSWERVRRSRPGSVEKLIRLGGFANRKEGLIRQLLGEIYRREGRTSLRVLRRWTTSRAFDYLVALPGVGEKTARCVLMYSLNRAVLPVDTHVWRISKRLGWIRGGKHPDRRASAELEAAVPPRLRRSLHVAMVAHGRAVCRAVPRCGACLLEPICPQRL
jgi:endonuclease III